MLNCYGCPIGLGDGPGVDEEMRLIYGDNLPPQFVDPWGNVVTPPQMLDSELMATSAGDEYREFWRQWQGPMTADPELTALHVQQRDLYESMPAAPLTRAPYGPAILYRPEDAAPREPVVTDVQYLAPVTGYGPTPARGVETNYVNTGLPADGFGPPSPVRDAAGNLIPSPTAPLTPIVQPPIAVLPSPVLVTTEPRPGSPSPGWASEGDGPPRPVVVNPGGGNAAWWIAAAALLALM